MASGVKSFVLQVRAPEGRRKRRTLGRFGARTLVQARNVARMHLGEIAKGEDPWESEGQARAEATARAMWPCP